MYLYIMRHGETDDNTRRVLQGQKDNPLNERGREQAREAGRELSDLVFDKIYVSPLRRAVETAELATGKDRSELVIEERIKEIGFGVLEGLPSDELKPPYDAFFRDPANYQAPEGGESLEELAGRIRSFLDELKGSYPGKNILLVSHGAAIHSIVSQIRREGPEHFWDMSLANCGILVLSDESGEYEIVRECKKRDSHYTRF